MSIIINYYFIILIIFIYLKKKKKNTINNNEGRRRNYYLKKKKQTSSQRSDKRVCCRMHGIPGQPVLYGESPKILHALLSGSFSLLLTHRVLADSFGAERPRSKAECLLLSCLLLSQWAIFVLSFLPVNALSMNL